MDKIWAGEQRHHKFIMRHYLDGEDQQHIPAATTHLKQLSKRNHKLENVVKNILAASFEINPNASRTSVAVVYCVSPCVCGPTLVVSTRSLTLSRAWLILKTIQSNRALYRDLAMESRTVPAWRRKHTNPFSSLETQFLFHEWRMSRPQWCVLWKDLTSLHSCSPQTKQTIKCSLADKIPSELITKICAILAPQDQICPPSVGTDVILGSNDT